MDFRCNIFLVLVHFSMNAGLWRIWIWGHLVTDLESPGDWTLGLEFWFPFINCYFSTNIFCKKALYSNIDFYYWRDCYQLYILTCFCMPATAISHLPTFIIQHSQRFYGVNLITSPIQSWNKWGLKRISNFSKFMQRSNEILSLTILWLKVWKKMLF